MSEYTTSPAYLNSITQLKESANTVFVKVDNGIYKVEKDRNDHFTGELYVSTQAVINELNRSFKVLILEKSALGSFQILHYS